MGVVYRARHVLIDRVVAVKLIRPDLRGETHLRAWMLREARAANRVDHAHIIDIHDIGETEEGELYLVMEYLVGTSLSSELARGPMPLARGVDILEQMCAALARAHDLGVVHRDLKSDNILLTHARRPERLREDPRLRPRPPGDGPAPRAQGRGVRHARVHGARAGARRGGDGAERSLRARRPVLRDAHRAAALPQRRSRDAARDAAHGHRAAPALDQARRAARGRDHRRQAAREGSAQALPGRPPPPRGAQGAAAQPARARRGRSRPRARTPRRRLRRRRSRRASSSGRAAPRSSRAWCRAPTRRATPRPTCRARVSQAWDLAARATRLEGEVASHTRKLEALERRGRALRAEIGRKVEELAHEESRALREPVDASRPRWRRLQGRPAAGASGPRRRPSRRPTAAAGPPAQLRAVFERAGAAAALRGRQARAAAASTSTKAAAKDAQARDLRRQIEELRAQLARYAEALEEDLVERPREGGRAHARGAGVREGVQRGARCCCSTTSRRSPRRATCCRSSSSAMHGQSGTGAKSESRTPG